MNPLDAERPLEHGTVVARNYRVLTRLGAGGMGTVYLAENLTLKQRVVVKVLRGGEAGAGHEEAQALANLQHPNVVTVYAHDPQLDCIVMEFLDGSALSSLLEKGIDRVNAIRIALSVAEALAAVHKRGLVHRDIKPENVMLALNQGGGGRFVDWLKLIDFGTALKVGKVPEVLLGTPEYCPPEQFHPEAAHPANDVYALGVTIFLMLTGVFPFECPREELPHHHHEVAPPALLDTLMSRFGRNGFDPRTAALLEDLSELVAQMLAKRLQERPTAQEVARRLTRLESSFAEAGTFVGGGTEASLSFIEPLVVPHKPSGRSVLSRALVPWSTGESGKVEVSTSATAPDAERVVTSESPALERGAPSVRKLESVPTQLDTPVLRRPSPQASAPTRLVPRKVVPEAPVPEEVEAPAPQRTSRGLIIGLVVVVVALAAAVVSLDREPQATPADPSPVVEARPVPPPTEPTPKPTPPPEAVVDAGAPVVEAPVDAGVEVAVVDAGVAPPALAVVEKKPRPTPKTEKSPGCLYDEALERNARKAMTGLIKGATADQAETLEDLGDELHAAFKARDCRQTQAVLKKMRGVVRPGAK